MIASGPRSSISTKPARGADLALTSAIDAHIETAKAGQGQPRDGSPEAQLKSRMAR
jgi:hypothetical protein